jgi:hypothetical protein
MRRSLVQFWVKAQLFRFWGEEMEGKGRGLVLGFWGGKVEVYFLETTPGVEGRYINVLAFYFGVMSVDEREGIDVRLLGKKMLCCFVN